jgi:hypothetical protein
LSDEKEHHPNGSDDGDEPPSAPGTALPGALPPELAALPPGELHAIFEEALILATRMTKSPARGRELLSALYKKVTTTRRWDATRAPLRPFVVYTLRQLMRSERAEGYSPRERKANEGYHREIRPERVDSAEEMILEKAEADRREAKAIRELAELERRIAGLPLAKRIVEAQRERDFEKPAHLAAYLREPVEDVYRAQEMLRYHLKKIREEGIGEGETTT